jgi:hypothetical protein
MIRMFISAVRVWIEAFTPMNFCGTLPQWLSAIVAGLALLVARDASQAWQKTLTAKRGDDLIIACFDVEAAIGRFRDGLKRDYHRARLTDLISEIYNVLLELKKYYVVAQREYPLLDYQALKAVEDGVDKIRDASDLAKNVEGAAALAARLDPPAEDAQSKAGSLRAKVLAVAKPSRA